MKKYKLEVVAIDGDRYTVMYRRKMRVVLASQCVKPPQYAGGEFYTFVLNFAL